MTKKSYSVATPSFLPSEKIYSLRTRLSSAKRKVYGIRLNAINPFRDNISQYPLKLPATSRYSGVVDPDVSVFAENIKSVSSVLSDSVFGSHIAKEKGATIVEYEEFVNSANEAVSDLIDLVITDRLNEKTIILQETQDTIRRSSEVALKLLKSTQSLRSDTYSIDLISEYLGITNKVVPVSLVEPNLAISEMQYEALLDPSYEKASKLLGVIHGKSLYDYYLAQRRKKEVEVRYTSYEVVDVILKVLSSAILEFDTFEMDARPTYIPELFTSTRKTNYETAIEESETAKFLFSEIQTIDNSAEFFDRKIDNYSVFALSESAEFSRVQAEHVSLENMYTDFNYVQTVVDAQEIDYDVFKLVQNVLECKFYNSSEAVNLSSPYESKLDSTFTEGIFVSKDINVSYVESDSFTRLYSDKEVTITNEFLGIDRANEKQANLIETEFFNFKDDGTITYIDESIISILARPEFESVMNEFTGSAATARPTYLHEYEGFSYVPSEFDASISLLDSASQEISEYEMTVLTIDNMSLVDRGYFALSINESHNFSVVKQSYYASVHEISSLTRRIESELSSTLFDYNHSLRVIEGNVADIITNESANKNSAYISTVEELQDVSVEFTRNANILDDFGDEVTRRDIFKTSVSDYVLSTYIRPEFNTYQHESNLGNKLRQDFDSEILFHDPFNSTEKTIEAKISDQFLGRVYNEFSIEVDSYLDVSRIVSDRSSILIENESLDRVLAENYSKLEDFTGSDSTGKPTYVQEYEEFGIVTSEYDLTIEDYLDAYRQLDSEYTASLQELFNYTLVNGEYVANIDETLRTTLVNEHVMRISEIDLSSRVVEEIGSTVYEMSQFSRLEKELWAETSNQELVYRSSEYTSHIIEEEEVERLQPVQSAYTLTDVSTATRENEADIFVLETESAGIQIDTYISELLQTQEFTRDRTINSSFVMEIVNSQRDVVYNTVIEEFTDAFGPEPKEYTWLWHSRPQWWSSWNWRVTK